MKNLGTIRSIIIRTSDGDNEYYGADAVAACQKIEKAIENKDQFSDWIFADDETEALRFNMADVKVIAVEIEPYKKVDA